MGSRGKLKLSVEQSTPSFSSVTAVYSSTLTLINVKWNKSVRDHIKLAIEIAIDMCNPPASLSGNGFTIMIPLFEYRRIMKII